MDSIIGNFQRQLLKINLELFSLPFPTWTREMAKTTQCLRVEFGDISYGTHNQKGIADAVSEFLKCGQLANYRDTKYVCFGIASHYGNSRIKLIEHERLFPKLLDTVKSISGEPRKFRSCYQGLLTGYFRYPGLRTESDVGKMNWGHLRTFLHENHESLKRHTPVIEWVQALDAHRNLLTDTPCKPYIKAVLGGDMSVIEELKKRLGIDDDTWVMDELVMEQVRTATNFQDKDFIEKVSPLLKVLEHHPLLLTEGLALLIKRYEQSADRPEHEALRDVSVREWGSPGLDRNKPLWHAKVDEPATQMVSVWLNKNTIRDFFELLQTNGQADRERMEFWLQYADQIDDIWLALGDGSIYNQNPDYKRIRHNMSNRYMGLTDINGNLANDNAFIMRIGGFVFIEFGRQNNACHVFSKDNLPFTSGQERVSGTRNGLKNTNHPGHQIRLTHNQRWQGVFAAFLRNKANATPGQSKPDTRNSKNHQSDHVTIPNKVTAVPQKFKRTTNLDMSKLRKISYDYNLIIDDRRSQGEELWLLIPFNVQVLTHEITQNLSREGFEFKEGIGWWLK